MSGKRWNHHVPLLLELKPIAGHYIPRNPIKLRSTTIARTGFVNKGYRNLGYWINSVLTNTAQPLINVGGTSFNIVQFRSETTSSSSAYHVVFEHGRFMISLGTSSSAHDVSRYDLFARSTAMSFIFGIAWTEREATRTLIKSFFRSCMSGAAVTFYEAGLYMGWSFASVWLSQFLLARTIIPEGMTRTPGTEYEDGWVIEFPANYTRVLPELIASCGFHTGGSKAAVRAVDGATYALRYNMPSTGTLDLMIGSDNTPPSPDDYNLRAPIASLSSQSQSVEVDTTLQECRIVRSGTYTPSASVTLGEVGLFLNVYDVGGTARKVMIARGVWDVPVTLEAGQTYAIGIVMRLG